MTHNQMPPLEDIAVGDVFESGDGMRETVTSLSPKLKTPIRTNCGGRYDVMGRFLGWGKPGEVCDLIRRVQKADEIALDGET